MGILKVQIFTAPILGGLLFCAAIVPCSGIQADTGTSIVPDGTLGTTVTPNGLVFDIDGGTIRGTNQFHSFDTFSVGTGDIASFNGPAGIKNIVSRVTGGTGSEIDGTLASTIPGANLFLLNPAGILFGPNAQLAVDGSFHASTADYVKLADSGVFFVDPASSSVLTTAAPSAFGFINPDPAAVQAYTSSVLAVPEGETLSLVGGPVEVGTPDGNAPGFLLASQGRVNLVSVASPGEVAFDGTGFNVDSVTQLGDVNITGGSIIDSREVFIQGGQLVIEDSLVSPGVLVFAGLGTSPDGGEVNIQVSNDASISGTGMLFGLFTPGIETRSGSTDDLAPATDTPDIQIAAGGTVSVSGIAAVSSNRFGPGNAADVTITADTLEVTQGGSVSVNNLYAGSGGTLTVSARNVELSNSSPNTAFTGLAAQSDLHPGYANAEFLGDPFNPDLTFADSGTITVNAADSLSVSGGAEISTDSFGFGNSGDINLNVGNLFLSKDGADSGKIAAQSGLAGDAGNITIDVTGTVEISDGFQISTTTLGSGDGGIIDITVGKSLEIDGTTSGLFTETAPPTTATLDDFAGRVGFSSFDELRTALGIPDGGWLDVLEQLNGYGVTAVADLTAGNGGTIDVTAPQLIMSDDARISSSTLWDGNGGEVIINTDNLNVNSGAAIRSQSGGIRESEVLAGIGNGGVVNLTVEKDATITGQSALGPSGISTNTIGAGNSGDISLSARTVSLNNGGSISASSSGSGFAGDIAINAQDKFDLNGGNVSTQATVSDGGNVIITANNRVYLLNSEITTSVESGSGGGGNITIDPQFVILNQSNILANAFGGPGGNINIVADNFIISAQSRVDASSALGLNGTVNISSPDQDVAQELAVLPENFLDVTGLISDRCGTTAGASSLVSAGPGGLAVDPDGYLPSFGAMTNAVYNGENSAINSGKPLWALALDTSALQLAQVTCTR